jgi:hypothetical protein
MAEDKKNPSSLKLAWKNGDRDARAEATGFGILAVVIIAFVIVWLGLS